MMQTRVLLVESPRLYPCVIALYRETTIIGKLCKTRDVVKTSQVLMETHGITRIPIDKRTVGFLWNIKNSACLSPKMPMSTQLKCYVVNKDFPLNYVCNRFNCSCTWLRFVYNARCIYIPIQYRS